MNELIPGKLYVIQYFHLEDHIILNHCDGTHIPFFSKHKEQPMLFLTSFEGKSNHFKQYNNNILYVPQTVIFLLQNKEIEFRFYSLVNKEHFLSLFVELH